MEWGGKIVRLVSTLKEPGVLTPEQVEQMLKALGDRCRKLPVIQKALIIRR